MKELMKYLGAIVVLIGVVLLIIYYLGVQKNALLATSGIMMVLGFITHIFLNKKMKD